jgi:hypothetical protein
MLTEHEANVVRDLIYIAENYVKEGGGCDHSVGICFCVVTVQIIEGYAILHNAGFGNHRWVTDYDWNDDGTAKPVLRCEQCYVEKSTVQA